MDINMWKEYPPEERAQMLHDNCDKIQQTEYSKSFDEQEIASKKHELVTAILRIQQLKDELDKVKKEYKEKLKPHEVSKTELMDDIKYSARPVIEDCFVFLEHDENKAYIFNSEGEMVLSRPLTPDERQKTIHMVSREKTGTND